MKIVENILWLNLNEKIILVIGDSYKGSPVIKFKYDYLMISEKQFKKYKKELIFEKVEPPIIYFI